MLILVIFTYNIITFVKEPFSEIFTISFQVLSLSLGFLYFLLFITMDFRICENLTPTSFSNYACIFSLEMFYNITLNHRKSKRVPENIFCFIDYAKAFDCVDHNKLWKIFKEMGITDYLTCFLRNLYAGQEATVRTGHGTTDWFQIGKGVHERCILSPCLFNSYAENIMQNARLDEAQAGIKIAGRNINNLRYADDTTLIAESEEELKSLLMEVNVESEKVGLKFNIQKTKIIASGPITSWQIHGETMETVRLYFLGLQNDCRW